MAEIAALLSTLTESTGFCGLLMENRDVFSSFSKGVLVSDIAAISGQTVGSILSRNIQGNQTKLALLQDQMSDLFNKSIINACAQNALKKEFLH